MVSDRSDHPDISEQLGVDIDPELLVVALTHRSYAYEHPGERHNERLEFLGDSILGQAVTVMLFTSFVSTVALAETARRIGLGAHLRLGRGEELTGGRDKSSILADTVEALIGATFLSRGGQEATALVLRLIDPLMDDPDRFGIALDPKTALQELAVAGGRGAPVYRVAGTGPDHARVFTAQVLVDDEVLGEGEGTNKKNAEMVAALAAVELLRSAPAGP